MRSPELPDRKKLLLEAFVSWLEQRLTHKGKRGIEIIFVGELPDLQETQSGKDPIRIGEEEKIRALATDEAERLLT